MSTLAKQIIWVLATIAVAAMTSLSIDLGNPDVPDRMVLSHLLAAIALSVGALLAKFPQKIWTDEERAAKVADPKAP